LPKDYTKLKQKITAALAKPDRNKILLMAMKRGRDARRDQLATLESPEGFREEIKEIKTRSISNLDSLIETFVENCRKNGNQVFVASTGQPKQLDSRLNPSI